MSKRDYRLYIEDILECIEKISKYTQVMDLDQFSDDEKSRNLCYQGSVSA
jgi:uncharacterized protein with HEPN domain